MTSTRPSFSRRMQACDFFVSFMGPSSPSRCRGGLPRQVLPLPGSRSLLGGGLLPDDLLRHLEGAVGGRDTAVDGRLEQHLLDLVRGEAVAEGGAGVEGQLVEVTARDQRGERDAAARTPVKARPVPDLAPRV